MARHTMVFLAVVGLMVGAVPGARAAVFQVNGSVVPGSTWNDLRTILSGLTGNETVRVSGNLQRPVGSSDLAISASGVTLSGGWDASFTSQAWAGQGALANELSGYSTLDAQASSSDQSRILTVSGANVTVEGFTVTGGYVTESSSGTSTSAGVHVTANGVRLSHLNVTGNTLNQPYENGGVGINLDATNGRLEYLTVTDNHAVGPANTYWGAIKVTDAAINGKVLIANCYVAENTTTVGIGNGGIKGSAIGFENSGDGSASTFRAIFGSLITSNPKNNAVWMDGSANRDAVMANTTMVDNAGAWATGSYKYQNYITNCVLADNRTDGIGFNSGGPYSKNYVDHSLIDTTSRFSSGGSFFGARTSTYGGIYDQGGNLETDALFTDQAGGDYTLQPGSAGTGAGLALYDANGFAYVDLDHDGTYDAGLDVIVDILPTSGYTPSASEFYYPTDLNGNEWVTNDYGPGVAPVLNIGAYAPTGVGGPVPEPAGLGLVGLALLALGKRTRR